jgi:beta-galactosidase/beta-glucuronidase
MSHRVFDRVEAVVGEQVWNFADFATVPGIIRVGGNKKGVFTATGSPRPRRTSCGAAGEGCPDLEIIASAVRLSHRAGIPRMIG